MPVAPSFQNYEQIGEPFIENKKSYVIVRHPNTHNDRKVRWYSPTEFAKLYPQQAKQVDIFTIRSQKDVMAFEKGFITVLKGDYQKQEEWYKKSIARYCRWWGWYIISTAEVPALPDGITAHILPWEVVEGEPLHLLPEEKLVAAVQAYWRKKRGS